MDDFAKQKIAATNEELVEERDDGEGHAEVTSPFRRP